MRPTLIGAALSALLASPAAHACGGFFCNQAQPVVQNAERIAFGIDARGFTDAHVQIFYEGPADEFAWVVPVPSNPDVFISSDALFNTLAVQLAPTFQLITREEGKCRDGGINLKFTQEYALAASDAGGTTMENGIDVIQQGQVGPYDMVVIQADSEDELLDWLVDNGYDLPPGVEPLLAPYVAEDAHFLALKLQKDKDTGDIAPIGFRYEGDTPAVPIQLTSVAAADDMRLEAYVFASHRVVPQSYLHVQINEAAINWWNGGQNYADVITQAANEAGGHAFATDFAGSPDFLRGTLYDADRFDADAIRTTTNAGQAQSVVFGQGWPQSAQLTNALEACDVVPYDAELCADILEVGVLEPLMAAESLLEHAWVSRMTSSLDAAEMTVDPVFVRNPDMGTVSNQHVAEFVYDCNGGKRRDKAMRRLDLADGRSILIPSEKWMEKNESTPFRFIKDLTGINAAVIEATGANGQPDVVQDHTDTLWDQMNDHNAMVEDLTGCGGCSSNGSTGGLWLAGVAAVAIRRRRQR